jgi:crotonobetainyl-CoA:carnitine CoA-transferase CaiB-like acyl-CoA transferase
MSDPSAMRELPQPLTGLKVVEFTHMVMGPTCGMVLADLGAEVIKVEPIDGDRTRTLLGAGIGFFPMFNRTRRASRSICTTQPVPRWPGSLRPAPTWWPRTSSPAR